MPTYEYQCSSCGHAMELFQSITAKPVRKCPECGRNTLKRLIGIGAGVLFKGEGFWQTDYRSESYKSGEKSEKGDGGGEKKGEKKEGKGEAKSEAKGEAKGEVKGEAKTESKSESKGAEVKKKEGGKGEKKSGGGKKGKA